MSEKLSHSEEIKQIVDNQLDAFVSLNDVRDLRVENARVARLEALPEVLKNIHEHVNRLQFAKVLPCDVCIANFLPREQALELGSMIFDESMSYAPEEMNRETLEQLYPEYTNQPDTTRGLVRVHGVTAEGKYQTYCHFCDDDMCLSQVSEGKNWDLLHEQRYRAVIPQLPHIVGIHHVAMSWDESIELSKNLEPNHTLPITIPEVVGYYFSGSTAWSVHVDILVPAGITDTRHVSFMHEGRMWTATVTTTDNPLARQIGHKLYKTVGGSRLQ